MPQNLPISQMTNGSAVQIADQIPVNRSGSNFRVGINFATMHSDFSSTSTPATTNPTTLKTYALPGNTLLTDGSYIKINAIWQLAGNANSKVININFRGINLGSFTTTTVSDTIIYEAFVIRENAADFQSNGWVVAAGGGKNLQFNNNVSCDWTSDQNIDVIGTNGVASLNDITSFGFIVQAYLV